MGVTTMRHSNDEEVLKAAWEAGEAISTDCIECGKPYVIDPAEDRDPTLGTCEECEERPNLFLNPTKMVCDLQALESNHPGNEGRKTMPEPYEKEATLISEEWMQRMFDIRSAFTESKADISELIDDIRGDKNIYQLYHQDNHVFDDLIDINTLVNDARKKLSELITSVNVYYNER